MEKSSVNERDRQQSEGVIEKNRMKKKHVTRVSEIMENYHEEQK